MLKGLEISGFKSFAKKTSLEFKSRITAIVGPNGSGKSNIAESFRFVLGEQSVKSMRGKRGEDLIWNGSTETPRSNRASVKLVFDNKGDNKADKKLFSLDFDDVSIERVVNRDGTNEYSINGSRVRLRDIMELLAEANIGSSGHHIISQGEADRILSSNEKERRVMIEDALGLKIYQYKREESQKKLAKTKENISQVETLRKEVAPHLRFLRKQVEKVVKAASLKDELVEKYKTYLSRERIYLESSKENIEREKSPLLSRKEELGRLIGEAQAVIDLSTKALSRSEELVSSETEIRTLESKKNELLREIGKLEGEIRAYERAIERSKTETEGRVIPFSKIKILKDEVESFVNEAEVAGTIEAAKSALQNIKYRIESIIGEYTSSTETNSNNQFEIKSLEDNRAKLETEITTTENDINLAKEKYNSIRSAVEKDKDSSREAEKTLFNLLGEQNRVNTELSLLDSRVSKLQIEEENFKREIEEAGVLLGQRAVGLERTPTENIAEERNIQEERRREIERIKIRIEEAGGAGGEEVMKEFNETVERDQFLEKELSDLSQSAASLQKLIEELRERLDTEFRDGVNKINKSFREFFSLMFGGGEAELRLIKNSKLKNKNLSDEELGELVDTQEETEEQEEGIDISVSLPRKRIKGLEMLSGGERALTSIALLFAISQVNPPPFVILDETDAALDEANSKKYGDMIESLSKYSQLILITHNRETMSRAGIIYGVTMGKDGVSRLLSIAFDEAVSVAK